MTTGHEPELDGTFDEDLSDEKCDHLLDFEETHCVKCLKPIWMLDTENVLERIEALEQEMRHGFKDAFDSMNDNENKFFKLEKVLLKIINEYFSFKDPDWSESLKQELAGE